MDKPIRLQLFNDEPVEEVQSQEPNEQVQEQEPDFSPLLDRLELKHLKETHKVSSLQELKELGEMGLDYKRVRGKYDEAKPKLEFIDQMLKGYNYQDFNEFKDAITKDMESKKVQDYLEKGIPEEFIPLIEKGLEKEALDQRTAQEQKANAEVQREIELFQKYYPEQDINNIPDEVIKNAPELGLVGAMALYERTQSKIQQKQAQNERSSPGSASHMQAETKISVNDLNDKQFGEVQNLVKGGTSIRDALRKVIGG